MADKATLDKIAMPDELRDLLESEDVDFDFTLLLNPKKDTVAYWIKAGMAAAAALDDVLLTFDEGEGVGAKPKAKMSGRMDVFAPWDVVTDAAADVAGAVSDVAGGVADVADEAWGAGGGAIHATLGFANAVTEAAGEAGAAVTDTIGDFASTLAERLVPDGLPPLSEIAACASNAVLTAPANADPDGPSRVPNPISVGVGAGAAAAMLRNGASLSVAGPLGALAGVGTTFAACALLKTVLGDRVWVSGHRRNGLPVNGYYRSLPRATGDRGVVVVPDPVPNGSDSSTRSLTAGVNMSTLIKTFGSHPDAPPEGMLTGIYFNDMVKLNLRTADGRLLRDGGFGTRELPIAFSVMTATQHGEPGRAEVSGMVDLIEVYDDGSVKARGWIMDSPSARMAGRMVQMKVLRGNSVELSVSNYEVDFDLEAMKLLIDFTDYQISATTLLANPAMEGCFVELEDPEFDFGEPVMSEDAITAASSFTEGAFVPTMPGVALPAGVGAFSVLEADAEVTVDVDPSAPPSEWFADPGFDEVTPGRIRAADEHGRIEVYGHIAAWGRPHLGVPGTTLMAPKSRSGYAYFANAEVLTTDGEFLPVGVLTYGGNHAAKSLDWREAQAHYDDSCNAWAAVAVGEDEFGIWYHGYVLPGTDNDVVTRCRSLGISGDWRRIGGNLEMVAALSVNARGFPLARPSAFTESGRQTCLVGAGAIAPLDADAGLLRDGYVPLDPESRVALNMVANFAKRAEAKELREELLADQAAELADIEAAL